MSIPTLQTRRQLRRQYEPGEPFFQQVKLLWKAMLERLASLFRPLRTDVAEPTLELAIEIAREGREGTPNRYYLHAV